MKFKSVYILLIISFNVIAMERPETMTNDLITLRQACVNDIISLRSFFQPGLKAQELKSTCANIPYQIFGDLGDIIKNYQQNFAKSFRTSFLNIGLYTTPPRRISPLSEELKSHYHDINNFILNLNHGMSHAILAQDPIIVGDGKPIKYTQEGATCPVHALRNGTMVAWYLRQGIRHNTSKVGKKNDFNILTLNDMRLVPADTFGKDWKLYSPGVASTCAMLTFDEIWKIANQVGIDQKKYSVLQITENISEEVKRLPAQQLAGLTKTIECIQLNQPIIYTFIVWRGGHWVSVVVEIRADGSKNLYYLDSSKGKSDPQQTIDFLTQKVFNFSVPTLFTQSFKSQLATPLEEITRLSRLVGEINKREFISQSLTALYELADNINEKLDDKRFIANLPSILDQAVRLIKDTFEIYDDKAAALTMIQVLRPAIAILAQANILSPTLRDLTLEIIHKNESNPDLTNDDRTLALLFRGSL